MRGSVIGVGHGSPARRYGRAVLDLPVADPWFVVDRGAVAVLEANRSLGQVVAARAMRMAMEKAEQAGIGFVGVYAAYTAVLLA